MDTNYFEMIMKNMKNMQHRCPWDGCTSTFNRPNKLALHLLIHNNIKAFVCDEANCYKSYTTKSHLDRHRKISHQFSGNDMVFSCPICLKMYVNRQNLKRHINMIHGPNKSAFICDICKRQYKKKHHLHSHMYQHTGIKSFSCEFCSHDFVTLYEKRKHMRNHKTYTCDMCELQFDRWSKYLKHKKFDHVQKEFECNDCGRIFKKRIHIVRHVKIHLNTAKVFTCHYLNCERTYSRNSNLKQHILIKHVKMLHECPICDSQLSTKAKLQSHIKLHEWSEPKKKQQKTKATGRKERKDKGIPRVSTALKLAGIKASENYESIASS